MSQQVMPKDAFTLYDLKIETIAGERPMACNHPVGSSFTLSGENLCFPEGTSFPLYPLAALLPLLPAKQRPSDPNDWMSSESIVACPDPNCGGRFKISRLAKTQFRNAEVARGSIASKIIRGLWQLAPGHQSQGDNIAGVAPIKDAIDHGLTCFDCADIYPGTEALLKEAIAYAQARGVKTRVHTKYVPNRSQLAQLKPQDVEQAVQNSLDALGVDSLDLLQFHWWDFAESGYGKVLTVLNDLKQKGLIRNIGLTNFDLEHLKEATRYAEIAAVQVQFSLFDRRPEGEFADFCQANGIKILAYGGLLGGFCSERWLHAKEPSLAELNNRSLVKYKLIIDELATEQQSGWEVFAKSLQVMAELAQKLGCSIANVAHAFLCTHAAVDQIIVGLSPVHFHEQNRGLQQIPLLSHSDLSQLLALPHLTGKVYGLERQEGGKHAAVMRTELAPET